MPVSMRLSPHPFSFYLNLDSAMRKMCLLDFWCTCRREQPLFKFMKNSLLWMRSFEMARFSICIPSFLALKNLLFPIFRARLCAEKAAELFFMKTPEFPGA